MQISDEAAVPDFRSSTGLFKTLRNEHKLKASGKQLFDASVYQTDSSTSSFHDMVRSLSHLVREAKPTAFHDMLSTLGTEGRLLRLYTQNVDGIDVALPSLETNVPLSAKGPWARSVQLHGGLEKMVCSKCSHLSDFQPALFEGPEPPLCRVCIETDKVRTDHAGKRSHGIGRLRPRIVLYNEHNPDEEAIGAVMGSDLKSRPDAVIVVGTSMKIPGVRRIVREMCGVVRGRRDGLSVWINQDGPPPGKEFEDCWDLVVKGPCDEVARQWNEARTEYANCTESEVERAKQRTGEVKVMIESQQDRLAAIPTPAASPRPSDHPKLPKIKIHMTTKLRAEMFKQQEGASKLKPGSEDPKPAARVGVVKKPRGRPSTKPQQRLDFKVTKSVSTKSASTKSRRSKATKAAGNHLSRPTPMEPLSPSAARNNGPVWTPSTPLSTHSRKPTTFDSETPKDDGRWDRRRRETISPTGTVPKDMVRLLDG